MRTNFTSDTYSKGQRERAPGKSPSCRFYSCSKSPLSRGPAREIRTEKGVEGALGPLNVLFVFLFFFFCPPPSLSSSSAFNRWDRPVPGPITLIAQRHSLFLSLSLPMQLRLFIIEKYIMTNRATTADVCAPQWNLAENLGASVGKRAATIHSPRV